MVIDGVKELLCLCARSAVRGFLVPLRLTPKSATFTGASSALVAHRLANTRDIVNCPSIIVNCIACRNLTKKGSRFCPSCLTKVRRYQIKLAAIAYKGGSCSECGRVVQTAAFEFHHRDPTLKGFEIGPCANRSMGAIRAELDKCDLLCAACHRTHHSFCEPEIMEYVKSHPLSFTTLDS